MKQRMIALLLVLAMGSAIVVSAVAEEPVQEKGEVTTITAVDATEAKTTTGVVTEEAEAAEAEAPENAEPKAPEEIPEAMGEMLLFKDLEELVKKNNLSYKSLGATIGAMDELESISAATESGITTMEGQIDALKQQLIAATDEEKPDIQAAIDVYEEKLADAKQGKASLDSMIQDTTQMEAGRKQLILGAQTVFIALVSMEQQKAALERQLAGLDRTVEEMKLRADMGQVSQLQLMELESGRGSLVSGLATLRMNISNYKMQLEQMVGKEMTGKIRLGTLPAVTDAELDALDFEADLKMVERRSTDVQAASASQDRVYDMAIKMSGMGSAIADMMDAADYSYKEAKLQAEMKFRMLYAQLQDCRQIVKSAETALECEELACQAAELKYSQGAISENTLLAAKDELSAARDSLQTAKNDLFSTYNNYCWAVKHGVLN